MSVAVNDTHDADHRRIDSVVHGIGIAHQQCAPEQAAHDEMLLGRTGDLHEGIIDGIEEPFGRRW